MEIESLIAIVLSVIAIVGCVSVYMVIPEVDDNPVTWGAITQYNDDISIIRDNVEDNQNDIKILDFEINNLDIDDGDDGDDWYDMDSDEFKCLKDSNTYKIFKKCLRNID